MFRNFARKSIAAITIASFIIAGILPAANAELTTQSCLRLAGDSRYATAVKISSNNWGEAYNVVLARGDAFPDALAGAVLANSAVVGGPLLLTESNCLLDGVLTELIRLKTNTVYILGGSGAVSGDVEKNLNDNGIQTKRIQGGNRYETAANIALTAISSSSRAFLASGQVFADALSISSYAAANGIPLLLTDTAKVPVATFDALKKLGVTEVTLIGGQSAVNSAVANQLTNAGYTVDRLSGDDRYKTNTTILNTLNFNTDKTVVATGTNFPDALAGSVLAARDNNPIVLVPPEEKQILNSTTSSYLDNIRAGISNFFILGGLSVINAKVEAFVQSGSTNPPEIENPPENANSKVTVQFWDGYASKSTYENQLGFVPEPLSDYIDILVPNFAGGLQEDGSFAYRFSSSETPQYLVSLGQSKGAKVVPMVMGSSGIADSMLQDPAKRETFIASAVRLISETNADGIFVDMEALSEDSEEGLTALMAGLYSRLHPEGKLIMIAVMSKTSPTAESWYDEYNYSDLSNYTDYIQIMSYDKHYSTSAPGPIAPPDWVRKVMSYAVTQIPSEKILMGVPYYGRSWRTNDTGNGWVSMAFGWAVATQTAEEFGATITRETTLTDPVGVPTFKYVDESGYNRTAYFDDRLSWRVKLDIMDDYDLAGIGGWSMIWINDISTPELYPLLKEKLQ